MAVSLRGFTQMTTQSDRVSLAWPTGTVAGDLAVLIAEGGDHRPTSTSGWVGFAVTSYTYAWYRRVTSADLASPLACRGHMTGLQSFALAASIGRSRAHEGVTLSVAGAGALLFSSAPPPATAVLPATDHVGTCVQEGDNWQHQVFWLPRSAAGYAGLSGTDDDTRYYVWEILPQVGPLAPTLVSPVAGAQVDTAAAVPFAWLHQSTASLPQEQCKVRVRVWTSGGTGTWYWVTAAGTWTTTDTTLTQSTQTLSLNSGVLTAGTLYEWAVATYDSATWSAYAPVNPLTAVAKPTVNSIFSACSTGDLSPTIAHTATAGAGSLSAWQVRVCASADATSDSPLWDSLPTAGTAASTVAPATTAWTNGATYYAWCRVMQSGGLWSAWTKDDATFTVSWTAPSAPSSVTAANIANAPLQVTITGLSAAVGVQLQSSTDGATWSTVVTITAPSATEVVDIPLAPYAIATYYRARIYTLSEDVQLWSAWTTSTAVASTDTGAYLVADTDRTSYLAVEVTEDSTRKTVQGVSVTYGHGSTRARIDRTEALGESGQTILLTLTATERAAIVAWLTDSDVWWLRWNPERTGATTTDAGSTRMGLAGEVDTERLDQLAITRRTVSFQWIEQ
jgi:hypothetical protein